MKIQVISDTHTFHKKMSVDPTADMILHMGDETNHPRNSSNYWEFVKFIEWFGRLPIEHKLLVPGNHSAFISTNIPLARDIAAEAGVEILINQLVSIDGVSIYGSPYTPPFGSWYFMAEEERLERMYSYIDKCDILATHGPPEGVLDMAPDGRQCGSVSLKKFVNRVKPSYHVFGHIHDHYELDELKIQNSTKLITDDTTFVNASFVDNHYKHFNIEPKIIEI